MSTSPSTTGVASKKSYVLAILVILFFWQVAAWFLPSFLIRRQLSDTEEAVTRATGKRMRFMRPPVGWFTPRVLRVARAMGYEPVIGTVHPDDSRRPGESAIVERVRRRIQPGAIIILHDGGWRITADRSGTVAAADRLTDELLEGGYRFETLSQLAD